MNNVLLKESPQMRVQLPQYDINDTPLDVEFEILPQVAQDLREIKIQKSIRMLEEKIAQNQSSVEEVNRDLDRLTNHADGWDYVIAVASGILAGLIDSFYVEEWDFGRGKAESNKIINKRVEDFAKKDPEYQKFLDKKRSEEKKQSSLDNAIEFLEQKYKLPGDSAYKDYKKRGITDSTHHLDDFCHHPTLIGVISCIAVQFTGEATYHPSMGDAIKNVPIEINEYGKFASNNPIGKIFSGIINWFINVAGTIKNQKGHLMSDMAGSSSSVGKNNEGAGIPGPFLSLAKELSSCKCFKDSSFGETLRKAYQNGIGKGKKQVDLGVFNALFEGAKSNKLDMRTEMAIEHELKRQTIPIIINEVVVRAAFFIRRLVQELKSNDSIEQVNWHNTIPFGNRTIERMITIATSTFTAVDLADAAIRSAIETAKEAPAEAAAGPAAPAVAIADFAKNILLRVNFVGLGRCVIAIGTDFSMGIEKHGKENERIKLMSEQLILYNGVVLYKEANMWIKAENAEIAISKSYQTMQAAIHYYQESITEISENMAAVGYDISRLREYNKDFYAVLINQLIRKNEALDILSTNFDNNGQALAVNIQALKQVLS